MLELGRAQVLAARAAAHHLDVRLAEGAFAFAAVAGVAGVRKTKTTPASFAARIEKVVSAHDIDAAREPGQELVTVFGPRGAVHIVPRADLSTFTLGALPADEQSLRATIKPFIGALDAAGMTATDALDRTIEAALEALSSGPLHKHELTTALSAQLPPVLVPPCRGRCPDRHVEDLLFRFAGVSGAFCFHGATEDLVRSDQYVPDPPDPACRREARAELVRRYLSAFGPASPKGFAAWLNVTPADARQSFADIGDEVFEATIDGTKAGYVLAADGKRIEGATAPAGVRLLPPFDPYLEGRERDLLVPERAHQKRVWRSSGAPGVVLVDGEVAGTWRTKTDRRAMHVGVEMFVPAAAPPADELTGEARRLAACAGRDLDAVADVIGLVGA